MNILARGLRSFMDKANNRRETRWRVVIRRESLTCNHCNSLAVPVYRTSNKYMCVSCGRRFANKPHYITDKLSSAVSRFHEQDYNDIVRAMKR